MCTDMNEQVEKKETLEEFFAAQPMRNPQTVSLTWLPYPENKPNISGPYFIQDGHGINIAYWSQPKRRFSGKKKIMSNGQDQHRVLWNIIAYAELPEPYWEDTKSEKPAGEYQSTHISTAGNGEPAVWD